MAEKKQHERGVWEIKSKAFGLFFWPCENVADSCGYDTCFRKGLVMGYADCWDLIVLVIRLHSEIGQIHLSIEAQCDHLFYQWVTTTENTMVLGVSYCQKTGIFIKCTNAISWLPQKAVYKNCFKKLKN